MYIHQAENDYHYPLVSFETTFEWLFEYTFDSSILSHSFAFSFSHVSNICSIHSLILAFSFSHSSNICSSVFVHMFELTCLPRYAIVTRATERICPARNITIR